MKQTLNLAIALVLWLLPLPLLAQGGVGDVGYVPTPQVTVNEMLRMAKVSSTDFVIDLGSGDGRMVITAAKKFGASGLGVDLDQELVRRSNEKAQHEGVADRVKFLKQNLFETDLSRATVITSYLLPEINRKLVATLLNLRPGTRVVSHDYDMADWPSDQTKDVPVPGKIDGYENFSRLYLWIVPAKIGGRWRENKQGSEAAPWEFELKQTFQAFKGTARRADQEFKLQDTKLEGEHIRFRFFADGLTRAELNGIVKDDVIEGTLVLHKSKTEKKQPFSMKRIPDVNLNTPQPTAP